MHFVFLVVFGTICIGLAEYGDWTEPNGWVAALGVLCLILGIGLFSIFDFVAKNVAPNQIRLLELPVQERARVMESGCLPMLLALGYGGIGLLLLIVQDRAFLF